nr:MAG TPA: hypothetical protein [Bacteriophage sp.]
MMYIILAAVLIAIAAYYPIKLIKFYCMESKEQSVKNQIIKDLRAGRVNQSLINIILGKGGLRLVHRELDHIFEWMVMNTDEWRVTSPYYDGRLVVVFGTSPFHPAYWQDVDTYKNVMRQMFGEYGTKDFRVYRASMAEADRIWKNLKYLKKTEEEPARVNVYEYVRMMFGNEKVLAMVVDINDANEKLVTILSGTGKGQKCWVASHKAMEVIPNDVAIAELVRLKEEWKEEKRKKAQEAARIEFQSKYGNIKPGTYLRAQRALYIVDSVDTENKTATCVRLVDLGVNYPANEKCVLLLENGFKVATPEEAAQILVKEYCNE